MFEKYILFFRYGKESISEDLFISTGSQLESSKRCSDYLIGPSVSVPPYHTEECTKKPVVASEKVMSVQGVRYRYLLCVSSLVPPATPKLCVLGKYIRDSSLYIII